MRTLVDRVIVVTGASSGIGRATAQMLAEAGSTVLAVARRSDALEELAQHVAGGAGSNGNSADGRIIPKPADVTDADAMERVAADAIAEFGRLDAWVNNAAVNQYGWFEELPIEEWRRVIETNLFGAAHGAHAAIPHFRSQGEGVLVNVASVLATVPSPLQSAYITSKFAMKGLSDALRQELRDAPGIKVSTLLPGPVDTPLFQHAANRTGYRISAPQPAADPRRVAAAIARNLVRPRREVAVGAASARPILLARRLMPAITERLTAPIFEAIHLTDEPHAPTPGNVYEPMADVLADVTGGWSPIPDPVRDWIGRMSDLIVDATVAAGRRGRSC